MTASIIETTRLRIVPFAEEHLTPRYVAWLNDPAVTRYSEQRHRAHTLASCRAYWQSFENTPHCLWAILAADMGNPAHRSECDFGHTHIGNINAYVDKHNGVADVGILIGERGAWGSGYGTEAWTAVCRHLLCGCGLRKITAGTLSVNTGMLQVMRRAGMTQDGRRVRQAVLEGRETDVVYMALFREHYTAENGESPTNYDGNR